MQAVVMRVAIRSVEGIVTEAPRTDSAVSASGRRRTRWVVSNLPYLVRASILDPHYTPSHPIASPADSPARLL